MSNRASAGFCVAAILLVLSGCSGITDPQLITSFEWGEVEVPEDVVPGVQTTVALGDLFVLGQMQTPTRCYVLDGGFQQKGKTVTIQVTAEPNGSENCNTDLGGFRYTAVMSNLKFGTYELRVIHDIVGGAGAQYTKTIIIK